MLEETMSSWGAAGPDHSAVQRPPQPLLSASASVDLSLITPPPPQKKQYPCRYMANKACKQLKKRLQCKRGHVQTLALQVGAALPSIVACLV